MITYRITKPSFCTNLKLEYRRAHVESLAWRTVGDVSGRLLETRVIDLHFTGLGLDHMICTLFQLASKTATLVSLITSLLTTQ